MIMKTNQIKLLITVFLCLGLMQARAQKDVMAAGGNATGSGGSASYSVGQVVYTTATGTNGSANQGVQQPYEISVVTWLPEASGINLVFSAYPNPAKNYIILKIENFNIVNLTYKLYDNKGKLILNKKVEGIETQIDMSNLVIATYYLYLTQSNKNIKTFQVIKY